MKKLLCATMVTLLAVGSTGCMCNGPLMRWAQSHNAWLCGGNGGYGGNCGQCASCARDCLREANRGEGALPLLLQPA